MRASTKRDKAIEALRESEIEWTEIGTGTNRLIFRYDTFAFKLALDEEGMTSLHFAAEAGKGKIIPILLKYHANPFIRDGRTGRTAVFCCGQ